MLVMITAGALDVRMIAKEMFSVLACLHVAACKVVNTASSKLFCLTKILIGSVLVLLVSFVGFIVLTFIVPTFADLWWRVI